MKAILPVAGLGTRLRPLTLRQPKYLIDIAEKPLLQYALDELCSAGVYDFIFVLSLGQEKIRHYINSLGLKRPRFVLQKKPIGNAHAILKGSRYVNRQESVVVSFGDDVLVDGDEVLGRMIQLSKETQSPVILLERVPRALVSHYGVVKVLPRSLGLYLARGIYEISGLVEKPSPKRAPSNLAIVGRYVLTPLVLKEVSRVCAKRENMSANGEFYLTDALKKHLQNGGRIYGIEFTGRRFDCGSRLGLMKAQLNFSLAHPEFGRKLLAYVKKK